MRTINISVTPRPTIGKFTLGRRGENLAAQVVFDISYLRSSYGEGVAVLLFKRYGDDAAYPVTAEQDGDTLIWTVSDTDTAVRGLGQCELFWYVDELLAKSCIWSVFVDSDIGDTTTPPPSGYESWVDTLTDLGAETLQHAQDAAQSASAAETAQTAAETAQSAAETAQTAAEGAAWQSVAAKAAAQTAQGKAEDAQEAAETAQGKAETAQGKAETAQASAESAASAAETARALAYAAQVSAETAMSNAEWEKILAGRARDAAETAQAAAETAQGKAEDAQEAAEEVLESIPQDYSELSADVGELKSAFESITEEYKSINLFDADTAVRGYNINNSGAFKANENFFYELIPAEEGTYFFYGDSTQYGTTYVKRVHLYDKDKEHISYITGTHPDDGSSGRWYSITFTISASDIVNGCKYFGVSQHITNIQRLMVVKGSSYPANYVPYWNYIGLDDVYVPQANIYGGSGNDFPQKTALFFGASICDGVSAQDGKDGYAGRIGRKNKMAWSNYGKAGATFVQTSGHTNIVGTLDTAVTAFPKADYIILEGGANDADLSSIAIGTYTNDDYSGSYDTTTFSGAFETAVFKAVTYWKTAHVGYIVPHKMGTGQTKENRYTFFVRAMDICKKWGVQVCNLWDGSILNSALSSQYDSSKTPTENIEAGNMYTDGQHLAPAGYDYITPIIEHWMRGL